LIGAVTGGTVVATNAKGESRMNIKKISAAVLCTSFALSSSPVHAQVWTQIEDPDQVRQLISEKTMDGKYWKYYFRSDGKLAYAQGGSHRSGDGKSMTMAPSA